MIPFRDFGAGKTAKKSLFVLFAGLFILTIVAVVTLSQKGKNRVDNPQATEDQDVRIFDLDLPAPKNASSSIWPCSKDKKASEQELLSGKYWACRFIQRHLTSPKDRIPAYFSTGLDEENGIRVVIVADQGMSDGTRKVLEQIKDFQPHLVIQNGDFDYQDNPKAWLAMIDQYLDVSVPFIAVLGNHDVKQYAEYQKRLAKRLKKGGFKDSCFGFVGVHFLCNLYGILVTSSPAGTIGTDPDDLQKELLKSYKHLTSSSSTQKLWRICSYHKVMKDYQVGVKPDESGFDIYETCRALGAMIANGHEHSYARTKNIFNYPLHEFSNSSSSDVVLDFSTNFAVVTGMGGYGRNPATLEARSNPWWAAIAASDDGALDGALYCTFYTAHHGSCYFKDTLGKIWDTFNVQNQH